MSLANFLKHKGVFAFMAVWAIFLGLTPQAGALPVESQGCMLERQEQISKITAFLENRRVAQQFKRMGLDRDQLINRIATLEDAELSALAEKTESINSGGDAGGLFFAVLIITLIVIAVLYFTDYAVKVEPRYKK